MKKQLAALLLLLLVFSLSGCGEKAAESETRTVYAMDTVMNLTVYGEKAASALENAEKELAAHIYEQMQLSARAYHRMLRVARTIADLEDSEKIKTEHLTEAMCYRTTGIWGKESKIEKL